MANTVKQKVNKEFSDILDIISGESKLREREEEIKKLKEQAIENQKTEKRKVFVIGSFSLNYFSLLIHDVILRPCEPLRGKKRHITL